MGTIGTPGGTPSIQDLLVGVEFPISKDDLLARLATNGAPESVLETIRKAVASRFGGPQDVMDAIRGG